MTHGRDNGRHVECTRGSTQMDERLEGGVSGPVKSYSPIDVDAALVCLVSGVVPILERGD